MKKETCKKCKHYANHYIQFGRFGISQINCGHCCHSDANSKKPNCPYFEEVTKPEPKQISVYKKLKGIENSIKYITETLKEIKTEIKNINN